MTQLEKALNNIVKPGVISPGTKSNDVFFVLDPTRFLLAQRLAIVQKSTNTFELAV
jgi:hypothetical protein